MVGKAIWLAPLYYSEVMRYIKKSFGGLDYAGLLTIAFLILKSLGKIDWSWWWVLSPILIVVGFWLCVCVIAMVVIGIKHFLNPPDYHST